MLINKLVIKMLQYDQLQKNIEHYNHINFYVLIYDAVNEISIRIDNGTIFVQATNHSLNRDKQGLIRDLLGDFLVYGKGNFRDKLVTQVRDVQLGDRIFMNMCAIAISLNLEID